MVELLEQRNLADGRARDAFLLAFEPDAFQGDNLASLLILRLPNDTVGALAELGDALVFVQGRHRGTNAEAKARGERLSRRNE